MSSQEQFLSILAEYDEAVREVERKRKPFDGLLGFGSHPSGAPCHEKMDQQVEALCRETAEQGSGEEAAALAEAVLRAEKEWKGPEYARLMLVAIQRHTLPLLGRVGEEERREMALRYAKDNPRRKRMPVQDRVMAALDGK